MGNKEVLSVFVVVLVALLFFSLGSFFKSQSLNQISGLATQQSSESKVQIQTFFSIAKATDLGVIDFGTVPDLNNANDLNATKNYAGPNNSSSYYITITDSNVGVDFCISGTDLQDLAGDTITLANYTWSNNTISNFSDFSQPPLAAQSTPLSTSFVNAEKNVLNGKDTYYRFYLDVPPGTSPGTYNNTIYFNGVATGGVC